MTKKLPLTKRLELALSQTTSEMERDNVYGLLAITAKNTLKYDLDLFYGKLTHESLNLSYNRKPISKENITVGKKLADYLTTSINLPQPGNSKDYRGKMIGAMGMEYTILRSYFEK